MFRFLSILTTCKVRKVLASSDHIPISRLRFAENIESGVGRAAIDIQKRAWHFVAQKTPTANQIATLVLSLALAQSGWTRCIFWEDSGKMF